MGADYNNKYSIYFQRLLILVVLLAGVQIGKCQTNTSDFISEVIDHQGNFKVFWKVIPENNGSRIEFIVSVKTKGFVGFGISPNGGMRNADMIIGGVGDDGRTYFKNYLGIGNTMPIEDPHPDWELIHGEENETHTTLHFSRLAETCDERDFPITKDTTRLIWTFGQTDFITYHGPVRGTYSVNLLDPSPQPLPEDDVKSWEAAMEMEMPAEFTSYWCSIHKAPQYDKKHHIIGFGPILNNAAAVAHTHHFVVYECAIPKVLPPGLNATLNNTIFEKHVGEKGNYCYLPPANQTLPTDFCRNNLFIWGNGGRKFMFPQHVGYPVGENPDEQLYYMLEIHYDNPQLLENVKYKAGIEVFYTDKLRKYDAAMLTTGNVVSLSQTIPPNSVDFMSVGHCAPACTRQLPKEGIKMFNVLLHAHLGGRRLKLRHFRGTEELPWILNDDNYDFAYQQNRPLSEEVHILPGDQLSLECVYDTRWRRGKVTLGGQSTTEEMCQTFTWYYPRDRLEFCTSQPSYQNLFQDLGILNITTSPNSEEPIITDPPSMFGKLYSEALNTVVKWTPEFRQEFQEKQRFDDQDYYCSAINYGLTATGRVKYPKVKKPYKPINTCGNVKEESNDIDELENTNSVVETNHKEKVKPGQEKLVQNIQTINNSSEIRIVAVSYKDVVVVFPSKNNGLETVRYERVSSSSGMKSSTRSSIASLIIFPIIYLFV